MILLVDDGEIQLGTRRVILERAGYFVRPANGGAAALATLRQNCTDLAMVITDHIMPGMNGPEFVTELRKMCAKVPVLVISGLEEAAYQYDGLNVTVAQKPCQPEKLLTMVREMTASPLSRTA